MKAFAAAVVFILINQASAQDNSCYRFLISTDTSEAGLSYTGYFISYLNTLYDKQVLKLHHLQKMKSELELQQALSNPLEKKVGIRTKAEIHLDVLNFYIKNEELDKAQLLLWLVEFLNKKEKEQNSRTNTEGETQHPYVKMQFHPVKGGRFIKGHGRYKKEIDPIPAAIDYDFEVMATPVTRFMWLQEMGELPLKLIETEKYDLPMTDITLWSLMQFANQLSGKKGYQPAYDLSGINFNGKASNGTLTPVLPAGTPREQLKAEDEFLKVAHRIIRNSLNKNGFRIPTALEEEFLLTDRGRSATQYFTGITDEESFSEVAWYSGNSRSSMHLVKEKKPLVIDGFEFFDLYGNTIEINFDTESNTLNSRCGDSCVDMNCINPAHENCMSISASKSGSKSFRLVRTLP